MTHGPGVYQMGGGPEPVLERTAGDVLGQFRHTMSPRRVVPLTAEERGEAEKVQERCLYCAGIHAGMSTPACPRLATFECDADGRVVKGSFWEGTGWAEGRVLLAEQVAEEDSGGEEAGDGER